MARKTDQGEVGKALLRSLLSLMGWPRVAVALFLFLPLPDLVLAQTQIHVTNFTVPKLKCWSYPYTQECGQKCEDFCSAFGCWAGKTTKCRRVCTPIYRETCGHSIGELPHGDIVNMLVEEGTPGTVEFAVQLRTVVKWRKKLRIESFEVSVQGTNNIYPHMPEHRSAILGWYTADLVGKWLVFSKARMFGVMTDMYAIDLAEFAPYDGKRIVFRWMSD